jgi:hypothetical protein
LKSLSLLPAMFNKRAKAKPAILSQRSRSDAEVKPETTQDNGAEIESPSVLAAKVKSKSKTKKPKKTQLSFGGDDEVRIIYVSQ